MIPPLEIDWDKLDEAIDKATEIKKVEQKKKEQINKLVKKAQRKR